MSTSIVVCGKKFDIGARVVLWNEPNGLNAYDTTTYVWNEEDRKTGKMVRRTVSGKRYSRRNLLTWNPSLVQLQSVISQFFLHHSGLYRAKSTFDVLHKERGLSCHFILDDDGTLYQTLDLKEKAWHGGVCNPMSIGIEIDSRANADRFPNAYDESHQQRYNVGPRRKKVDFIHGQNITGYEYNDAQYETLIRLAIVLCNVFPIIGTNADFPRMSGLTSNIIKGAIPNPKNHLGFICHYHCKSSKIDPIAFDYARFLAGVKHNSPTQPSVVEDTTPSTIEEEFFGELGITIHEPEPDLIVLNDWRDIQEALVTLGYNPGQVDGILGKKTRKALRSFQASNGLSVDGIWGPKTRAKMEELLRNV